ncbi:MAG TPA: class I tRNA ligase family protein [Flavisolibacter sp.]|nr:class I tRNA ligase family protein [Flavisolibacter sp.]
MEYNFRDIEKKWQQKWKENAVYQVPNDSSKPKYYVLDMFPYPSGAGLHVGHPLGYIASDIFARYKRLKGFNVLHPMGYDAFGLPAEQYAIEHGVHPAVSTEKNIATFRSQLDKIGFCYDWDREVRTSDPKYYKWTQWIFLQLFKSWYNRKNNRTESIDTLIKILEEEGNANHPIPNAQFQIPDYPQVSFSAEAWKSFPEKTKQTILMEYRIAYCGYGEVNWCEALGTVLANDEVVNGVSERGGYPVVKKKLRQWYLRITEYADRLLEGLQKVDFSDAMKEMQSNWIGKSSGAEIDFGIDGHDEKLRVYTTRPDTIFGVDFMVVAPEHELVEAITTPEQKRAVEDYITYVKSRSERERMAEKKISGVFTGAYALNPFDESKKIPIWISEYVLAGYGTGAIMAVPSGDERDHKFAKHFNLSITNILGDAYNGEEANPTKDAVLSNSGFLDGMVMRNAIEVVISKLEEMGIGKRKVNYKMRDAAFSRQRYWGEPFPIKWIDGIAHPLDESELPLELPHVESYKPGPEGEGPLANIPEWTSQHLETNTMPGYAGSSWYFLRYMDPHNDKEFCDKKNSDYWNQVDLYVGGTEHAVGHLLYSRMWVKALYDLEFISFDAPYKKLLNQGMIQGNSRFIYRVNGKGVENLLWEVLSTEFKEYEFETSPASKIDFVSNKKQIAIEVTNVRGIDGNELKKYKSGETAGHLLHIISFEEILDKYINGDLLPFLKRILTEKDGYISVAENRGPFFVSFDKKEKFGNDGVDVLHVDVNIVDGAELDIDLFKRSKPEYASAQFILGDHSKYICGAEVEKMSKSKFNTVNPDDIVGRYGADTFRMYEMFLGPVEMSKPWDTKGIEGVHRFLKKLWRLFFDEQKGKLVTEEKATQDELKVLHRTIKKIEEDTERFSYNTAVSTFMVCVNELIDLKCHKKEILEPLLILLTPYAPHISEELWHQLGNTSTILDASFPKLEQKYLVETTKEYPVSVNGKLRTTINIDLNAVQSQVEEIVLANPVVQKWIEGKQPKRIIYVKGKMVNVVV